MLIFVICFICNTNKGEMHMVVTMREMLADARKNQYAIPAFDISNYEMMKAVLETCEEEKSPALLMTLGVDTQGRNLQLLSSMVKGASDFFRVPVCLHMDHATDIDFIKYGCDNGYSSVMYDGSVLPFDENARNTAVVTEYAHKRGITVEAELGHVGNASVGSISETGTDTDPGESLTVPEEVEKFVAITDVDALAVAIGTSHGVYQKTPELRIDRLDEITSVCDRPLVLHGGSGTPDSQMQNAIRHGITKINIYSDVLFALNKGLKDTLNSITNPSTWPFLVYEDAMKLMKEVIREKLRTFGSAGRI
ncbi:MAG: class II fructose-bisphosphate aldolase [Ruminococcaceae bacterium]|nr:class II fructose-bisphosphate aldolase [Oscillospiraceae bacterium]